MHSRFLVTFHQDAAAPEAEARKYTFDFLMANGFVRDDNLRWGYGMADWFVIGGRWSGELSRYSWARPLTARMRAIEEAQGIHVRGVWYGDEKQQQQQHQLFKWFQAMWDNEAPSEYKALPIQRDAFKEDGYADDVMILTQELYDSLLKPYARTPDSENHADLDEDEVAPTMIGKKWIVVVDYHN